MDDRAIDIHSVLSVENHVTWKPSGLPPRYMLGCQSEQLAGSHTPLRHHHRSIVVVCVSGAVILVDALVPQKKRQRLLHAYEQFSDVPFPRLDEFARPLVPYGELRVEAFLICVGRIPVAAWVVRAETDAVPLAEV